jgi:hypothetical protein
LRDSYETQLSQWQKGLEDSENYSKSAQQTIRDLEEQLSQVTKECEVLRSQLAQSEDTISTLRKEIHHLTHQNRRTSIRHITQQDLDEVESKLFAQTAKVDQVLSPHSPLHFSYPILSYLFISYPFFTTSPHFHRLSSCDRTQLVTHNASHADSIFSLFSYDNAKLR